MGLNIVLNFKKSILLICLLLSFILSSCNYTKHLSGNQKLLGKTTLRLKSDKPIKYKGELESAILAYANPKPNSHLLDVDAMPKYKLWKYNNKYAKFKKDSLNEKIVKHKVEPPVLIDTNLIKKSTINIQQFMVNQGYFYADVKSEIQNTKNEKIQDIHYEIETGKYYTIDKVIVETENENFKFLFDKNNEKSFLKSGLPFTYFSCGLERERLYKIFRNSGLYDFKMDNISFEIDTINRQSLKNLSDDPFSQSVDFNTEKKENNTITVYVKFDETKENSYKKTYIFNDIFVKINDVYNRSNANVPITNNILDNIHFQYSSLPVNRNVIVRNIFIQKGQEFNTNDVEATINRLNQLGVFQFVNITFEKVKDDIDSNINFGKINCNITLNTSPKMDGIIVGDVSTSDGDYFLGFGGSLTFKNRNLFHGANQMLIRTAYSTEFRNDDLLDGTKKFYLSGNNASATAEFTFPKFIVPFKQNLFSKKTLPYTVLSFNYTLIQRLRNYSIINATGTFGYSWKETNKKFWRLNPSFLTITKVPDRLLSAAFKNKLETNSYLKNIFSDNTIYGENVTFNYKNNPDNFLPNNTALKIMFEEAGTILRGVDYLYSNITKNHIEPIAQYIKIEGDLRRYIKVNKAEWANRIMVGLGIPVGESEALPYIKRYSAGGAFSNRGWRARTLGPGRSIDTTQKLAYIDRTGDMKLEMNSEYRMNLLKLFSGVINIKGAGFVDIGNIWLYNKNSNLPGGEFQLKYLLQDLAMSAGVGLRLDFSFFVFRVDWGYPVKKPNYLSNYGFGYDKFRYGNGVYNIAIGYPF